jgi:hypothetical protein
MKTRSPTEEKRRMRLEAMEWELLFFIIIPLFVITFIYSPIYLFTLFILDREWLMLDSAVPC